MKLKQSAFKSESCGEPWSHFSTVSDEIHKDILESVLASFFSGRGNQNLWFQQDGAPVH